MPNIDIISVVLLFKSVACLCHCFRSLMQMQMTGQKATVQAIGPADFSKINGIDSYRQAEPTVSLGNDKYHTFYIYCIYHIICWESFHVVTFDLKVLITCLLLVLQVSEVLERVAEFKTACNSLLYIRTKVRDT